VSWSSSPAALLASVAEFFDGRIRRDWTPERAPTCTELCPAAGPPPPPWFPRPLNYAEQALPAPTRKAPALLVLSGSVNPRRSPGSTSVNVPRVRRSLRTWGVRPRDRVVGYLLHKRIRSSHCWEPRDRTGWACCAPDYGYGRGRWIGSPDRTYRPWSRPTATVFVRQGKRPHVRNRLITGRCPLVLHVVVVRGSMARATGTTPPRTDVVRTGGRARVDAVAVRITRSGSSTRPERPVLPKGIVHSNAASC